MNRRRSCQLPVASCPHRAADGNPAPSFNWQLATRNWQLPTGFTFTEILFAVMILGLGLVMIAAALPVAMRQSQANLEASAGRATAEAGLSYIRAVGAGELPIPTGMGMGTDAPAFLLTAGNRISSIDSRFAWVPLYSKLDADATPEVVIIAIRSRNMDRYPLIDADGDPVSMWAPGHDNGPHLVLAAVDVDNQQIIFGDPDDRGRRVAAEGAYLVLQTGLSVRVGTPYDPDNGIWNIWPGSDANLPPTGYPPGPAWIIGRGLRDPLDDYDPVNNPYEGPAQDVMLIGPREVN